MNQPKRMLSLPDVTLVAATSVAVPQTIRAMMLSLQQIEFGAAILLTDQPLPPGSSEDITWKKIDPIQSRTSYSRFMLRSLKNHISTSHALCVQWDGYVLDNGQWDPRFLEFDYIGAPWPHFGDGYDVGNGGFSLRSKRLFDACQAMNIVDDAEDVAICRIHRPILERDFKIRFAPHSLARAFAYERYAATGCEFGFHGVFNLARNVDARTFASLIAELEPGLLNRREHRELLWFAIHRKRWTLAYTLMRRMQHEAARRY